MRPILVIMSYIYIVPIETATDIWLKPLETSILRTFGLRTKCAKSKINLAKAFDLSRQQYNSSQILLQLIARPPADAVKILGVAEVDMFIPILTYIFGEAQLDGTGAVVSLHRLNNKFYGLPKNNRLLSERMVKESIHELGHTFGLIHCTHPNCALHASTYVEDIDQKSEDLCPQCRQYVKVKQGLQSGITTQEFDSIVPK